VHLGILNFSPVDIIEIEINKMSSDEKCLICLQPTRPAFLRPRAVHSIYDESLVSCQLCSLSCHPACYYLEDSRTVDDPDAFVCDLCSIITITTPECVQCHQTSTDTLFREVHYTPHRKDSSSRHFVHSLCLSIKHEMKGRDQLLPKLNEQCEQCSETDGITIKCIVSSCEVYCHATCALSVDSLLPDPINVYQFRCQQHRQSNNNIASITTNIARINI